MQRDPRLVPLSREHHAALRLGRQLINGGASMALGAQRAELAAHFAEEERSLAPLLETHGEHALAARLRAEHRQLEALFAAAERGEREAEAGRALIDHVRFEERELFPAVEACFDGVLT
ncbi:hemerythrin HHE cation-binding protein [Nitrogeniibacter mangrovi]|uniref:Hemerythrin HHE cation-binding protein n=1 Tax=Nitrogeniibacter mangrovi TaxID=2016596 RepID=A0A6C1B7A6_9RHOO|nr:hemerythrin domain-containing protein [Nitrogeniibacter mangrovi]QID19591.1 hemerythrin HHE cation-binding protein [Nitrogeniibacter mangrovi]